MFNNNDLKKTLLMPITNFPMKANLNKKEIEIEFFWEKINLYQKNLKKNKKNNLFLLHDGPPYTNGDIHIGHALNKILKDFILRFKTMQGFYTPFIPGWDNHGLPIEIAVMKKNIYKQEENKEFFYKKCENFALNFVKKQKKSFKRLGILGDWENAYLTLNKSFISDQIRIFSKIVENKLIFKDLKIVHWSPFLNSVLAESEIEYKNHSSLSIFLTFKIISKNIFENVKILVWTTTPWTLPANVAICAHPTKKYYLFSTLNNDKYIVGEKLLEKIKNKFNWKEIQILKKFSGSYLKNSIYENILFSKKGKIILDEFVSDTEGTGLVHIAPGHGEEDFRIGQKNNLPILCSVGKKGLMTEIAGIYKDIFYTKANELIVEDLKKKELILKSEIINHQYPHDDRIKKPVISLAISQWFLNIEKIRQNLLEKIKKVEWIPEWGLTKINNMIKDRKNWVISRQRTWGVPIPIFYTEDKKPILDPVIINHVADLFEKHGPEIWYKWDSQNLLPKNYKNDKSPNNIFIKEKDIIDVWFDSGTSYSVLQNFSSSFVSSNICLEGADQYRGWFNSSLITSVAAFNKNPYQKIITHGFVLDGKGKKMSKSLNNVINPLDIINEKGADILRLWVASINYNIDVKLDSCILKQIEEKYRKIRNILRFMLGNLNDFNPNKNYIKLEERTTFHQIFIIEFYQIIIKIIKLYEKYNFEKITNSLFLFMNNKISSFYLDFAKDILYIEKEDNIERRIIQSNIYDIIINLLKILTPIIPHTTSEAYSSLSNLNKKEDVYLESFPKIEEIKNLIQNCIIKYNQIEKSYKLFFNLREMILKKIEEARKNKNINKSLHAKIILELPEEYIKILDQLEINKNFYQLLIVSQLEIKKSEKIKIKITKAIGKECPRCWNVIPQKKIENLCQRCISVLTKN
ncbi:isoleucine--tRNA ligase [Candidatus Phytoplasma oryzae]|nr:isoleucine--tRNA ligase [Candidatus Phytoplasma oryzae]